MFTFPSLLLLAFKQKHFLFQTVYIADSRGSQRAKANPICLPLNAFTSFCRQPLLLAPTLHTAGQRFLFSCWIYPAEPSTTLGLSSLSAAQCWCDADIPGEKPDTHTPPLDGLSRLDKWLPRLEEEEVVERGGRKCNFKGRALAMAGQHCSLFFPLYCLWDHLTAFSGRGLQSTSQILPDYNLKRYEELFPRSISPSWQALCNHGHFQAAELLRV